jgi:hypothetical protein
MAPAQRRSVYRLQSPPTPGDIRIHSKFGWPETLRIEFFPALSKLRTSLGHSPEVDEAALHIRADQSHAEKVADVQTLEAARQSSFNGRMQKTDPRAFDRCAGDNSIELFSNP